MTAWKMAVILQIEQSLVNSKRGILAVMESAGEPERGAHYEYFKIYSEVGSGNRTL